ncbi:MAG TPA: hypothetical protein EYP56_01075 [Planctomycetaceae bacterium]|nr:hypothetical protein [Planctomycetaceae bacterium]
MRRTPWATYVWPGLPQLWSHGAWSGLFFAIGFAALVNLGLATSLLWSELFTPAMRILVWLAVGGFWVISAVFSYRWHRQYPVGLVTAWSEGQFRQAVAHYLKGDWFEAEHVLVGLLQRDPRDVDATLMLATLLRHTRRLGEAGACLSRLERLDGAEKWELEIRRERELLQAASMSRLDQDGAGNSEPAVEGTEKQKHSQGQKPAQAA